MLSQLSQSSSISEITIEINERHHAAEKHQSKSAANQYFCGHGLSVVKRKLPHGEFQTWLESDFVGSQRTAHRYMQFYRKLKELGIKPDSDEFDALIRKHGSVAEVIATSDVEYSPHVEDEAQDRQSWTELTSQNESGGVTPSVETAQEPGDDSTGKDNSAEVFIDATPKNIGFGGQALISAFDDLLTGPEIRDRVYRMGRVAIDPCANCPTSPNIDAAVCFTESTDGLKEDWVGGLAYVHPPYFGIENWVEKTLQEIGKKNIDSAVLLLPNQMETNWMAQLDAYVRVVIREPITIVNERTGMQVASAQIPMVVVYVGSEADKFVSLFSDLGTAFQRVLP